MSETKHMIWTKPGKTSNLAFHRPQSNSSRVEDELMHNSAQALNSATDPIEKLRLLCFARGGTSGILGLSRIFRRNVDDGGKQLTKEEFLHGLKESGLEISDHLDADELFAEFDTYNTGSISLDDFLRKLRPPMSESRRNIVEQAFTKLDKEGHGFISMQEIKNIYSCNSNTRYMNGDDTADFIINKFLANFETEGVVDGKVDLEEFMNYYSGISVSIDNDCYFDLMMRQTYKL